MTSSKEIELIGICGGSCSGKTTLVEGLKAVLGNQMAHLRFDDFFVGLDRLESRQITDWESPELYRYEDYIRSLNALKNGHAIEVECHSRECMEKGSSLVVVQPERFTVVEGFLIFYHLGARFYFDQLIYIDLPEEEIVRRRLGRTNSQHGWDDEEYIRGQLLKGHRRYVLPQRRFANLVLDGLSPQEEILRHVIEFIKI